MTHDWLDLRGPQPPAIPLVLDSPHSGSRMPPDFGSVRSEAELREWEDCFVDELCGAALARGAVMLAARFPRTYVDVNRAETDLDPELLAEPWPYAALQPGTKTATGKGLLWRSLGEDKPVYDRHLSVAEVMHRLECCYRPYHKSLRRLLDDAHARFGWVLHLNCHSMGATSTRSVEGVAGLPRPDFVLGDRDGSSCDPAITAFVAGQLRGLGYDVRVNDPFKGVELVRAYSRPAAGRHSLQLEVNKRLYMDSERIECHTGFAKVQREIGAVLDAVLARFAPPGAAGAGPAAGAVGAAGRAAGAAGAGRAAGATGAGRSDA